MKLLLSEPLPLRTARMLGDYAEDFTLAHRYGDLSQARFPLGRLDDVTFPAADHPLTEMTVYVDDNETLSWEARTQSDGEGNTWQNVIMAAPVDPDSKVSASAKCKRNPRTGALLENPADIIEDVLRIAGRVEDWSALRAECAAAGLRIAGSIDTIQSIRATIDDITLSVGAIWVGGFARLYPTLGVSGPVLELTKMDVKHIEVSASLQDTADILRLSYDVEDATGRPLKYIELTANPQRFGGLVKELTLPWLRTPANAESVGRRLLSRLAGVRYDVSFAAERKDIRPGQWLQLIDHPEWERSDSDPFLMPLTVEIEADKNRSTINAETILTYPAITVTAHSIALPVTTSGGVDIAVRNGVAVFTISDNQRKPMKGARVSLDGGTPKTTDERGIVSFAVTPGTHELAIQAPGFVDQSFEFEV